MRIGSHTPVWDKPRGVVDSYDYQYRTCSYCGSINIDDLLEIADKNEVTLDQADPKYGYVHKFYVHGIPNSLAGKTVKIGSKTGPDGTEDIFGKASKEVFCKLYVSHFYDITDEKKLEKLNKLLPFPFKNKEKK